MDHDAPVSATVARTGGTPGVDHCRFCGSGELELAVDLGKSPLCETFLTREQLSQPEVFYPLRAVVCAWCTLLQVGEFVPAEEIFSAEYPYHSSYSSTWVAHAARYVDHVVERFGLDGDCLAVELGSNDGYLLQHFAPHGVPTLGIEPAAGVAGVARERGIDTRVAFFDDALATRLVAEGRAADLVVGNNVLAQIPDLNGFVRGIATLLSPRGVVTIEVPHVQRLLDELQFDTIYHEHFSYFSLHTLRRIFAAHDLTVFDVDTLPTHGGSLRIYAAPSAADRPVSDAVGDILDGEVADGVTDVARYTHFGAQVQRVKRRLLRYLIDTIDRGERAVGYGAPGKANTLLNYCGIGPDLLPFTVDLNPGKQGRFTPGTHIPIHAPAAIDEARPDVVVILPWNLQREIEAQLAHIRQWGGRFVLPLTPPASDGVAP